MTRICLLFTPILAMVVSAGFAQDATKVDRKYVGVAECKVCHSDESIAGTHYNIWKEQKSQIETGKISTPSPTILYKLAKLYDFSYDRLLLLAGHPLPANNRPVISSRLQENLEDLSEEEKERVFEYIRFLKSRK